MRYLVLLALCGVFFLAGCAGDRRHHVVISAAEQKMVVLKDGEPIAAYPVSTSKFGLGDRPGSYATPAGKLRIKEKIGEGVPLGAVFKSRRLTGEILPVDAPGRDPIVTRILWLDGRESGNRNAYNRYIYIHGTPEERTIGSPTSYGCIRMRSTDVAALYNTVGVGARVTILPGPFPRPTASLGLHQHAKPL
jgi:lipoprotein-anchoring transpeptidase ErfK/SrfK